jgi:hypothetical protein
MIKTAGAGAGAENSRSARAARRNTTKKHGLRQVGKPSAEIPRGPDFKMLLHTLRDEQPEGRLDDQEKAGGACFVRHEAG